MLVNTLNRLQSVSKVEIAKNPADALIKKQLDKTLGAACKKHSVGLLKAIKQKVELTGTVKILNESTFASKPGEYYSPGYSFYPFTISWNWLKSDTDYEELERLFRKVPFKILGYKGEIFAEDPYYKSKATLIFAYWFPKENNNFDL